MASGQGNLSVPQREYRQNNISAGSSGGVEWTQFDSKQMSENFLLDAVSSSLLGGKIRLALVYMTPLDVCMGVPGGSMWPKPWSSPTTGILSFKI